MNALVETLTHISDSSPGFDTSAQGTDELRWDTALADATTLALPEADILVVSPHPDDETLGAGGLIRSATIASRRVSVLSVTDGENAFPNWRALAEIRRQETDRALALLGAQPIKLTRLGIPDGRVAEHVDTLIETIERAISPSTLLIAPYEGDGHPDHDAIGYACIDIAQRRALTLWRYPIWAWHQSTPQRFEKQSWGRFWLVDNTRQVKLQAIKCYTSQLSPDSRTPVVPPHVLPYFTRPYEAFLL